MRVREFIVENSSPRSFKGIIEFLGQHNGINDLDAKTVLGQDNDMSKKYYYKNVKYKTIYETVLNELDFQKRWELLSHTDITDKIKKQILDQEKDNTGKNLNVYQKADDTTQIIISDIEGNYFTVHHSTYDPDSDRHQIGIKLGLSRTLNIGFFSTIISLYLDALSRGFPVKISAVDENMWRSYNRVIEKLAEKYPNYHLGKTKQEFDYKYGVMVYSRVIIPHSKSVIDYRENMIKSLDK